MKKILVVVDMQNDFIDGALGSAEAQAIVPKILKKINYLQTSEGKYLPVEHCIKGTKGWEIREEIALAMPKALLVDKPTFGSTQLVRLLQSEYANEEIEIELVGLCTDICVVTNALLLKTGLPDVKISVDGSCCAGVTPESHAAALLTMKMCQVEVL